MVSIALLAQCIRLNKYSYTQFIFYGLATCRRIAYLDWASGCNDSGTHPRGIVSFLRTPAVPPDPVPLTPTTSSPNTGTRGYKRSDNKSRQQVPPELNNLLFTLILYPFIISFLTPNDWRNHYPLPGLRNYCRQKERYQGNGESDR